MIITQTRTIHVTHKLDTSCSAFSNSATKPSQNPTTLHPKYPACLRHQTLHTNYQEIELSKQFGVCTSINPSQSSHRRGHPSVYILLCDRPSLTVSLTPTLTLCPRHNGLICQQVHSLHCALTQILHTNCQQVHSLHCALTQTLDTNYQQVHSLHCALTQTLHTNYQTSSQLALCTDTNPWHKLPTGTQLALCTDTNPSHTTTKYTACTVHWHKSFTHNYQVYCLHCADTNPSHKLPSTQLALCRHKSFTQTTNRYTAFTVHRVHSLHCADKPFTQITKYTAYTVQTFHTNYQVHSLHCADTNPSHKLPTDLSTQLALCTDTNPSHKLPTSIQLALRKVSNWILTFCQPHSHLMMVPVSYTHLTLPTNHRV